MQVLARKQIAVIGLGYVGLPLAVEFGKHRRVVGFDIDTNRINELQSGHDRTLETSRDELAAATQLTVSCDRDALNACDTFIVTVPLLIFALVMGRQLEHGIMEGAVKG